MSDIVSALSERIKEYTERLNQSSANHNFLSGAMAECKEILGLLASADRAVEGAYPVAESVDSASGLSAPDAECAAHSCTESASPEL